MIRRHRLDRLAAEYATTIQFAAVEHRLPKHPYVMQGGIDAAGALNGPSDRKWTRSVSSA